MSVQTDNIFKDLNDQQIEAVRAIEGPVLILAGAGSGKTRALTHRIAHMISQGINPDSILAVTFTNKAAGEMRHRVEDLLKTGLKIPSLVQPMMGTFHSVCAKILRREISHLGYTGNYTIYDSDDQLALIKKMMQALGIDAKQFNPKAILARISSAKSVLVGSEEFTLGAKTFPEKTTSRIYTEYQNELSKNNALDFDDLLMLCVELFQKHPDVLERYQNRFRYILIDEYQDTNRAQYVWTNLLAKRYRNLFVIGDDYQSIYAWRKADIRNILDFEKDYPEAKVIMLEQNYRSTKNILEAANVLIAKNSRQKKKELWTDNPVGDKIFLKELPDDRQEGQYLIEVIRGNLKKGLSLNDITVLYRAHAQSRSVEEQMLRHGFPYRIIGGIRFYERMEIKDIIAYLRLASNPNDNFSFERICNVPVRGITKNLIDKVRQTADDKSFFDASKNPDKINGLTPKQLTALNNFASLILDINKRSGEFNVSELIKYILRKTNYQGHLTDKTIGGEERWENVKEILTASKKFDSLKPPEGLLQFLQEVALIQETDKLGEKNEAVNLMTLHSVKGLEFPVVFMVGMEEGIFPHSRSMLEPSELEEERRLCYVGVTRAKKQLHLTFCRQRMLYGSAQFNPPSRFLFEMPENLIDFSPINETARHELDDDFIKY